MVSGTSNSNIRKLKHKTYSSLLVLLEGVLQGGLNNSDTSIAHILRLCRHENAIVEARILHHHITINHASNSRYIRNCLIQVYGNFRFLEDAHFVFDQMGSLRNIYSWTLMIVAYNQHEQYSQAVKLYQEMASQGFEPDKVTCICAITACSNLPSLELGIEIHQYIILNGFLSDEVVRNALLHMYGKCGSTGNAEMLFDENKQNVISWNSVIGAYVEHGQYPKALAMYWQMLQECVAPDRVTFINILGGCCDMSFLNEAKKIHCLIANNGFDSDVVIATGMIKMYDSSGCIEDARDVFENLQHRDVMVWNSMINAYAQHGQQKDAFELFNEMIKCDVKPNEATLVSLLSACTSLTELEHGKHIHLYAKKFGFESNVLVGTTLVNMYGKCQQLGDARKLFGKLKERNVVSWTTLIEVHSANGEEDRALYFYQKMLSEGIKPNAVTFVSTLRACKTLFNINEGKEIHAHIMDYDLQSDVVVGTALVEMYGEFGDLKNARKAFDEIYPRNELAWTAMFTAYVQNGHTIEALYLFQQMQFEGQKTDKFLFITVLEVCSSLASLSQGKEVHASIVDSGFDCDVTVGTALVDMYGKCGSTEDAWSALRMIGNPNALTWTALIAVYSHAGHAVNALQLFKQMLQEKIDPDGVTFLSILSGCSHDGLVDEGWYSFLFMEEYNIFHSTEHYACMVDLICRTGNLDEALKLIYLMPLIPDVIIWRTFLGSCRVHDSIAYGEWAAKKLLQLDPTAIAPYVLLSNMYATYTG